MSVSQTMAQMIASARPQQAPPPGRAQVIPGGPIQDNQITASASIDIGAIQKLMNLDEDKTKSMVDSMWGVYRQQGASGDPAQMEGREKIVDQLQPILQKGFEQGHPGVMVKEIPAAEAGPPMTVMTQTMTEDQKFSGRKEPEQYDPVKQPAATKRYSFIDIPVSKEDQEAALLNKMPYEQKKGLPVKELSRSNILMGGAGKEARSKLMGAEAYIRQAGATSGMGEKVLEDLNTSINNYYKQYGKVKLDLGDNARLVFPENTTLGARISSHLSDVQMATGSYLPAIGSIDFYSLAIQKEIDRKDDSPEHFDRRKHYITAFANMLKKTREESPLRQYSQLMDWTINHFDGDMDQTKEFFATHFNMRHKSLNAIYEGTQTAAIERIDEAKAEDQAADKTIQDAEDRLVEQMVEKELEGKGLWNRLMMKGTLEDAMRKRIRESGELSKAKRGFKAKLLQGKKGK